jgi:hypothetical protein
MGLPTGVSIMYRLAEIKQLLKLHKYVPIVQKMDDGVLVKLPRPKLVRTPKPEVIEAYSIRRGDNPGVFHNSSLSPDEKFTSMPEYAIRLFVMSEVSACCGRLPISDELICYLDEEGREKTELESIVEPPSNQDDRGKEGFLTTLFIEARGERFPRQYEEVARTHGVREGYLLIKTFFQV